MASWIGKPNDTCETVSMLRNASLFCILWGLLVPELVICLPASIFLCLTLWVLVGISFLGFLYEVVGGVISFRLMASNRDVDIAT